MLLYEKGIFSEYLLFISVNIMLKYAMHNLIPFFFVFLH